MFVFTLLFGFAAPGLLPAMEAGALALPPGETHPPPGQRGLNDIEVMPTRDVACPACGFVVAIPEADKLMRRQNGVAPAWRMHFESRDRDFCPHPGKYKLAYQADIAVCPSCGYTAPVALFGNPISPAAAEWVNANLRPNLLATLRGMLGRRSAEMDDAEVAAFYNRQEEIPDSLRLEHERVRLATIKAPGLDQARLALQAAWAARRELASPPESVFLAKRAANALKAMQDTPNRAPGVDGEVAALRRLLGKNRSGKERLSAADRYGARVLLAGRLARLGDGEAAKEILSRLATEFAERFLKPEQDPLWSATSSRHARTVRLNDLELYRRESEREIAVRLDLGRREREYLRGAAENIRAAITDGELASRSDEVLYYTYLMGEIERRLGNLPVASEWFRHVRSFAPDSPWTALAEEQLERVRAAAADKVNLLAGMGHDAELFELLRAAYQGQGQEP